MPPQDPSRARSPSWPGRCREGRGGETLGGGGVYQSGVLISALKRKKGGKKKCVLCVCVSGGFCEGEGWGAGGRGRCECLKLNSVFLLFF